VASPNPGGTKSNNDSGLFGVSAHSATDAWAVGYYTNPTTFADETLVLRWNGTSWRRVPSPNPSGAADHTHDNVLRGVSAISSTDAWAVGGYNDPSFSIPANETLVLHWDGTNWTKVPSPNPGGVGTYTSYSDLSGVSDVSTTDAWAVGDYVDPTFNDSAIETLVLQWNGTVWNQVTSPNPGGTTSSTDFSSLASVSAVSATDAWAVGAYANTTTGAEETLIVHWNGTGWSTVASPDPAGTASASDSNGLNCVSVGSATDAWTVGFYAKKTLVSQWNGTSWGTSKL
jgi:hypothetical protein